MGLLDNLGLSGLGNSLSNFRTNIDDQTGGLLTRLGEPENQANLIAAASLLSGEGIPASFALRNQVRSNLLANQQLKNQREFIKKQFPNDPLAQAFPQLYAKQFLEKKFSTTAPKVDDFGLGNTAGERNTKILLRLGGKLKAGEELTEQEKILYSQAYETARKGRTFTETDAQGGTRTYQYGQLSLTGLPVPEGFTDERLVSESQKPLTEAQNKNAGFASRVIESEKTINNLEALDYQPEQDVSQFFNRGVFNPGLSPEAQSFAFASLNFVTAVLRRESGAAISKSEFEDAYRTYFPQFGDKPPVIQAKKNLRKVVLENLIADSGNAFKLRQPDFKVDELFVQPPQVEQQPSNNYQTMGAAQFLEIYKQAEAEKNKPPAQRIYSEDEYKKIMKEFMRRTN